MTRKVTVFCPIYNDSIYVDDFVPSVLKQKYSDLELLVLENGSVDDTREKLRAYNDRRLRLVTSHINYRSEIGANLLRSVESEFIAVIFSDDIYHHDKLGASIEALQNSGADACFSNNLYMRQDKSPLPSGALPASQFAGDISGMSKCEHLWHMVKRGNTLHPVSMVIRTDVYHELGGFRGDLHQIGDMEFFARLLLQKKVIFIKEPLQTIRIRDASSARLNESTISEAMHMRVRSERLNFLNVFRSPEALELVDQIFIPAARGIKVSDKMRLWFLGQQFVHEFEPDYRIFGMLCLYDALRLYGKEIEESLTSSIGMPPGVYMDQLSARVFNGFGLEASRATEFLNLQTQVQGLRRELESVHRGSQLIDDGKTSAKFLTAHIDDQALEVFKKESYEGKRRILKRLLKWDRPLSFDLPGFDQSYYLNNNKDVEKSGVDPMKHFLRHGWKEGRNPSAAFNMSGYLQANPDVKKSGLNALLHFLEYGRKEGRHGWNNY